jgi:parallel beta-helix repeat protein
MTPNRNKHRHVVWGLVPVAAALLLCSSLLAHAATYYVDEQNGNDQNAGSDQAPWATLQYASDNVAPSDIVIVRAGTYAPFELTTSGTASDRIIFQADPGVTVTDEINLEGASYITIDGFEITTSFRAGIRAVECEHVWLLNNRAYQNFRWGIFTGCCADLIIEDNECSESEDEHGIYVSNSGDRPTIRGNVLWSNNANGLHMNGDASINCSSGFIDNDGVISSAVVEQNTIFDNGLGGGSGINCDGVQDSWFANNLVYATHASGMSLYAIDAGAPSTGNLVINNTIVVADDGRWAMNIQDGSSNNTLYNNILLTFHASRGSIDISADSLPGLVSDYNVVTDIFSNADNWISLAEWQTATGQDANSVIASPDQVFVSVAQNDYHLSSTSPARDTGTTNNAPNQDLDGNPRPVGSQVDIGAYEYCEGAECTAVVEDCTNQIDDDGDGDTDCDDIDCASYPACQTAAEDCENGIDDDGDGDTDCDDSDCAGTAVCQAGGEDCENGIDDDGDGDTDCDDADCAGHSACDGGGSGKSGCGCRLTGHDVPESTGAFPLLLFLLIGLVGLIRLGRRRD